MKLNHKCCQTKRILQNYILTLANLKKKKKNYTSNTFKHTHKCKHTQKIDCFAYILFGSSYPHVYRTKKTLHTESCGTKHEKKKKYQTGKKGRRKRKE